MVFWLIFWDVDGDDEVNKMFMKHLFFQTTDLERERMQVLFRSSTHVAPFMWTRLAMRLWSTTPWSRSKLPSSMLGGLCKYPCGADVAYPRSKASSYPHQHYSRPAEAYFQKAKKLQPPNPKENSKGTKGVAKTMNPLAINPKT